jgi:hypothetical protein
MHYITQQLRQSLLGRLAEWLENSPLEFTPGGRAIVSPRDLDLKMVSSLNYGTKRFFFGNEINSAVHVFPRADAVSENQSKVRL